MSKIVKIIRIHEINADLYIYTDYIAIQKFNNSKDRIIITEKMLQEPEDE